ncbi:MAG: AAA family ATPase [Candidatus Competibacter sp.]|nr:AAA family ATPase [Candidatus Competibacter sp.]
MTPLPLEQIGLRERHHRSALWWLGILYRRPQQLREALEALSKLHALRAGGVLYLHALPYIVILSITGRLVLFGALGLELRAPPPTEWSTLVLTHSALLIQGIAVGIAIGIPLLVIIWIDERFIIGIAIAVGISTGIVEGIACGITFGIVEGIVFVIITLIFFGIAGGISRGIANSIVNDIAVGISVGAAIWVTAGIVVGIAVGITVSIVSSRAYYHPFYLFFTWPTLQGRWYPWHPVAWDDLCSLPFPGLDRLLVAYADHAPTAARTEIERLIDHYPSQRMAALRAKARLIARASAQEANLSRLDAHVARLPEGDRGFLTQTPKIRTMVGDICQLQMRLDTLDRPFLREPTTALLVEKIKNFQSQVAGFPEPLATEFRQAAGQWLAIAERQYCQVQSVLTKEPTPAVFRAGDPVDRNQEAFIPRENVLGDLDRQLTLSTGCPGLILYGRRRMGKSTLLRNLEGFLPTSVRIAVVSMQNPDAFSSQADLLDAIARQVSEAIQPEQKITMPTVATLKDFFQWLVDCNARLTETNKRLLLAIDEYENLDRKLGEGVFDQDLLDTVRESIQTHRQVTWVFAGSHAIAELTHAPWSSYLVSARTLEVPPFTEAETRRLLTEPLRYSSLWPKDDPKRPRFSPDFWGDGGIEHIHGEAGGWPHLVQLLAETVVDLCNDREQAQVDRTLLEQAITKAIVAGDTVLRQLMQPEDAAPGEWAYLRGFRTRDTQSPPDDETVYQALRRRLLVAEEGGRWRLRVPLLQRWLRERG